jgi:hypothetical protein
MQLRNRGLVASAEDFERAVLKFRCLRCDSRDLRCRSRSLARHVFGARRVAERAPCRHRPLAGPLDPGIGIEAGRARQFAGAGLIRVRAWHSQPPMSFGLGFNCRSRPRPGQ